VDTLEFHQWLQFIMLPRMWALVDSKRPLPEGIAVSPMAAHIYRSELEQYAAKRRVPCSAEENRKVDV
ncbi:YqcC family protein, partial [Burkholderia sp. SIMBA_045]